MRRPAGCTSRSRTMARLPPAEDDERRHRRRPPERLRPADRPLRRPRRLPRTAPIRTAATPSISTCRWSAMAEPRRCGCMVVDDEPLAVERLQLLLARHRGRRPWSAPPMTARRRFGSPRRWRPTSSCSTSPCPAWTGSTSPARFRQSAVDPAVVFVTAFDNFAVAAFDVAAIDYLMKPVQPDRLDARARPGPRPSRRRRRGAAQAGVRPCRGILGARS